MTAQMPSPLDTGNASVPSQHTNRLALTSFVLSLVPSALVVLAILVASTFPVSPNLYYPVVVLGGLGTSIAGTVTGIVAIDRGGRYPPEQARKGFATWGLVIGVLDICGMCGLWGL